MSNQTTNTTGHSYDGIQEYDNPLPGWWTWLFIVTVIFSVFYLLYFHTGAPERSVYDQFRASEVALIKKQFGDLGDIPQNRTSMVQFMNDDNWLKFGESTYKTHCSSCHGPDGGGLVGPNLADTRWKNVNKLEDIIKVINQGAGGAAMPAWQDKLDPREITIVSAYVASRLGQSASNPKGPEGAITIENWDSEINQIPESERQLPTKN